MDSLTTLLNNNLDVTDLTSVESTIATIEKYMKNISKQVEDTIGEQYSDISIVVNETDVVHQKAVHHINELQTLNTQIDKDLEVEIVSTEDTQKALMNRMLKSESMISILHQVCQIHDTLEETTEDCDVLKEAQKMKIVEIKLKGLCNRNKAPKILAEMLDRVKDRLLEIFKGVSDWTDAITIKDSSIMYSGQTTSLLDSKVKILEVVARSELKTIAELMASKIHKDILKKVLHNNMTVKANENHVSIDLSSTDRVLRIDDIIQLFVVLNENILPSSHSFRSDFWNVIIEEFVPEIKTLIKQEIPDSLTLLDAFANKYIPSITKFERCILEFKDDFECYLTPFVSNYHLLFALKYKEFCYNEARRILMSKSEENLSVKDILEIPDQRSEEMLPPRDPCSPLTLNYTKTNTVLRLPDFLVSQKVVNLARLISSILNEATSKSLSKEASVCLCETSKNIAELSIIPSFDPFDDAENPKMSAKFFCDCWYLSHVLFWQANELNQELPNEMFFDVVSLIRCKGAATLKNNVDSLLLKVITLLKQMGGLDGQNKENHGMVIEMAFVQIVALVIQYTSEWKKILPRDKYLELLGKTIDDTLNLISSETLIIPDISAKHSTCLSNNFSLLLDQLSKIRSEDLPVDSESWIRFKFIISLMDDSLVTIVETWENGILSRYFKSSEIQHLTRALFQNTDKNAALRRRITGDIL